MRPCFLGRRRFPASGSPIGALPRKRGTQTNHRASRRDSSAVAGKQPPLTKGLPNSSSSLNVGPTHFGQPDGTVHAFPRPFEPRLRCAQGRNWLIGVVQLFLGRMIPADIAVPRCAADPGASPELETFLSQPFFRDYVIVPVT